jgi:hypothetical protein
MDASSLALPPNYSLAMRLSSQGLTSNESAFISGDVIGLAMNCALGTLVKLHNLVV